MQQGVGILAAHGWYLCDRARLCGIHETVEHAYLKDYGRLVRNQVAYCSGHYVDLPALVFVD